MEAYQVIYTKNDGYVINCKVYLGGEEQEDEPWTTEIMFECILDKRSHYLNDHVRILRKKEDDFKETTSPAKAAARRKECMDSSSEDEEYKHKRRRICDQNILGSNRNVKKRKSKDNWRVR